HGKEARLAIRERSMVLLVKHLKVRLIGCRMVAATQLNAFARASLQFGEAEATFHQQTLLARSKTQQASSHILPCTARAGLTDRQDETHLREIGSELLGPHDKSMHVARD